LILQMDIGNTRAKWRLCRGEEIVEAGALERESATVLPDLEQQPTALWVASVAGTSLETAMCENARARWNIEPWFARTEATALGLSNSYEEPNRMGVDRWLAMLAGWHQVGDAVCVVDAGSALTIDFVSHRGAHLGGYILPGLDSMERALLQDTDRVRFADAPRDSIAPGRCTEHAVFNGLLLSQAGAVALALSRQAGDFALFFSGGNGLVLRDVLDLGGSFDPDLVLDGLALLAAQSKKSGALQA
jgi:type III pantothenate kinase